MFFPVILFLFKVLVWYFSKNINLFLFSVILPLDPKSVLDV